MVMSTFLICLLSFMNNSHRSTESLSFMSFMSQMSSGCHSRMGASCPAPRFQMAKALARLTLPEVPKDDRQAAQGRQSLNSGNKGPPREGVQVEVSPWSQDFSPVPVMNTLQAVLLPGQGHRAALVPGALPLATVSPGMEEALGLNPTTPQR